MTKGQATQWPKEKGQNDKQHNGQTFVLLVLLTLFFGHCVACHSVSFLLAIVLLVLLYDQKKMTGQATQ
jgi:hypothetical protein